MATVCAQGCIPWYRTGAAAETLGDDGLVWKGHGWGMWKIPGALARIEIGFLTQGVEQRVPRVH